MTVGFEAMEYSATEDSGFVNVCILLIGETEIVVPFLVETRMTGSAQGTTEF